MVSDEKLREQVNRSGFPLQIAVEHAISSSQNLHGWRLFSREHSWKNPLTGNSGFIDLILINEYRTSIMVIECKRVQKSHWIFLNPAENIADSSHAKIWITCNRDGRPKCFKWLDISIDPFTPESEFCVVPGQDNKSKPMLERVAADLAEATERFASEDFKILEDEGGDLRLYASVIVTTAELKVCGFSPSSVSLGNGALSQSEFRTIPYLRFRKQLSTERSAEKNRRPYGSFFREKENTVFVVNSEQFIDFLNKYDVDNDSLVRNLHGLY
jgi:hypothetical protein